jgi:hypothetical protein
MTETVSGRDALDQEPAPHSVVKAAPTLPIEPQPDLDSVRAAKRLHRAVTRGVAIGLIIRGGTHAATALAALFRKPKPGHAAHPGVRVLDALRWGAFLGSFGGVYVGVDEALRKVLGPTRCDTDPSPRLP